MSTENTTPKNPQEDPQEPRGKILDQANLGNTVRASWNFSLDDIRANIAYFSTETKEALIAAFRWCIDPRHPVAKPEFAKRVGVSDSTVYRILSGRYVHPVTKERLDAPDGLVKAIHEFLKLERERYAAGDTEFILTPTAKKIWTACDLARESQSPVFLWGVSHIGKTWALERYRDKNNHGRTIYCRMKAACGLGGMVKRIADCVGISDKGNTADLIERIKKALSKDTLLILDELHLLMYTYRRESFFACLEVIREIYDETECGLILCGTKLLLDKMQASQHAEMEQLMRRGVHRFPLPTMPTKGDIAAILDHNGLAFPTRELKVTVKAVTETPYDVLRQVGKVQGLKAITERLRYGRKLAAKDDEKFNWTYFVDAHLRIQKESEVTPDWN